MAKAIINKHVNNIDQVRLDKFISDVDNAKGEILVCNDPEHPSLWIKDTKGDVRIVGGGSSEGETGGTLVTEITQLRSEVFSLDQRVKDIGVSEYEDESGVTQEATGIFKTIDEFEVKLNEVVDELANMDIEIELGDTDVTKNFLEKEEGEKLAVRSIDTDSTILQEDIKIIGLGNNKIGNYSDGMTITSGTSIYTVLKNIFQKENYPTNVTGKTATATASILNKKLTLKNGDTKLENDHIVEVGERVVVDEAYVCGTTVSKTNSYITGMTYGYSLDIDNTNVSSDDSIVNECTTILSSENYDMNLIKDGFDFDKNFEYVEPTAYDIIGGAKLVTDDTPVVLGSVKEGGNRVTIHLTGETYIYQADKINGVYYRSNMGNVDENHYHSGVASIESETQATSSMSMNIFGKYRYFFGCTTKMDANDMTSDDIRALSNYGWVNIDANTTIVGNSLYTSDGTSIVIACPSKYELKTVEDSSGDGTQINTFDSIGKRNVLCGSVNVEYNVYMYPIESGVKVSLKNIVIGKVE